MAKTNSNLHTAKAGKNDEFYTQLPDVEKECKYYRPHFKDKVVLCNCNDGEHSAFAMYFILNFEILCLKELICTSYNPDGHGVVYRYKGERDGLIIPAIKDCPHEEMEGDGGFNTPEGIALIQEADIIVTNPPFSLFREFVALLEQYEKKYLIIGNMNAITYKEIFPLIKNNKIWLGPAFQGGNAYFKIDKLSNKYVDGVFDESTGLVKFRNCAWFTNLEHAKRHEPLDLYKKYTAEEYPKYDNYDAINVDKTADIPLDYNGVMGVPITFLDKYCPEQFEIVSIMTGSTGECFINGNDGRAKFYVNDKGVYARILIRKKQ